MNIRQQLLKRHSRANADLVEAHVRLYPEAIVELMACFLSDNVDVVQRASQVIGNLGRHQPETLRDWWDELANAASNPVHDAVRRNVARYFSELKLELPNSLESKLAQMFTDWCEDKNTPVAVAVFGMQFVADRSKDFPRLAGRIATEIRDNLDSGQASVGYKNRGQKILRQLSQ
jgi:hypothetical protein